MTAVTGGLLSPFSYLNEVMVLGREEPQGILMLAPYSYDLRTKAVAAMKRGECKTDVSRMLNFLPQTRTKSICMFVRSVLDEATVG